MEIKILKTPGCASCARAIDLIKKVVKEFPKVKIKEINLIDHPDAAVKYNVMSSPAIIIDEKVAFLGVPKEKDLREKLKKSR